MPVFNNVLAGAAGQSGGDAAFKIERSLRFNSSDSSSLIRQVTTKGSTTKFTWSGWIKRGKLSSGAQNIFSGSTGTDTGAYFCFPDNSSNALGTADALCFKSDNGAGGGSVETDAVFRDPGAWYSVVLAVDTTQSTASNRVKIWVNGVSQSLSISSSPGYPTQNAELSINDVGYAAIGAEANGSASASSSRFFGDFYLADVHFLDGIVVSDPDGVFGEFSTDTGVWNPIQYTGNHGPTPVSYSNNSQTDLPDGNVYLSTQPVENIFDGDDTTYSRINRGTNSVSNATFKWEPTGGYAGVTKIRIKYDYCTSYSINGGAYSNVNNNGGYQEIYNGSSFTLNTLEIRRTDASASDFGIFVYAIEINDTLVSNVNNNGFHLDFSDNSSNAALGDDSSGNSHTFTVNNLIASTDGPIITSVKAYSVYADASVSCNYTVDYSDDGSNWTNAFSGVMDNGSACGIFSGTNPGNGSYGAHKYWRYVVGSSIVSHHPRVSRIMLSDGSSDYEIQHFGSDNCNDSGGIPSANTTYSYTFDASSVDSLIDSPSNYDDGTNIGGNHCTFNPLDKRSNVALSNGNLEATTTNSHWSGVKGTLGVSSGKYYFEVTYGNGSDGRIFVGICGSDVAIDPSTYIQDDTTERAKGMLLFCDNGQYQLDTASRVNMTSQPVSGDVLGVSFDLDANTAQFYRNGTALGSIDISGSALATTTVVPIVVVYESGVKHVLNCGQRPFSISSVPTGHKSLCTQNLDNPLITDPSTAFDVALWTGNGGTQTISGLNHSPDLIWHKTRGISGGSQIYDTLRGTSKRLRSDNFDSQGTVDGVTAFNSDGWTMTGGNNNNEPYVSWVWDAGSSTTSLSAGGLNSSIYDQSQTWSNLWSGTAGYGSFTNLHDADDTDYAQSTSATLTFPSAIALTSLQIRHSSNFGTATLSVNGTDVTSQLPTSGTKPLTTITGFTSLSSISMSGADYQANCHTLYEIFVNGKKLVDNGVSVTNVPSVASSYRANQNAGFSITTWTGTTNAKVAHGLLKAPDLVITKSYSTSVAWRIWSNKFSSLTNRYMGFDTNGEVTFSGTYWGTMDSNTIGLAGVLDNNSGSMVAYCFHDVDQYQQHGKYVGNGNTDGPFIHLNFEPALVALKRIDGSGNDWCIYDTTRSPFNSMDDKLKWNSSGAELVEQPIDFLSNGFKPRNTAAGFNGSGNTYIYLAIARSPFKYARAR